MEKKFLPYSRQVIDEEDIESVTRVLRSAWLTTGPMVKEFEEKFAEEVNADYAIARLLRCCSTVLTTTRVGDH